ncbi:MAG: AAA family ATPase [Deltaproteobacteria bacterium]|nr:MAG: AAA family ATPase [Deltaproteobacteria bacterium]
MHLKSITLFPEKYPTGKYYPFNVPIFKETREIEFHSNITFFIGENGTGKSTLLEAIAHKCGIHIWKAEEKTRVRQNPYAHTLYKYMDVDWLDGYVPGSFFGSDTFRYFAQSVEEWAIADPGMLNYFGGKSLITQSHGQSLMSMFRTRYELKGLYLLDEPETALSPKSQLELLKILNKQGSKQHAQFIVASHSPILLACPGAEIYSFNHIPLTPVEYEDTEYYKIYKSFMEDRTKYFQ